MTLQPMGVEFVTKGYAAFLAQMGGVYEAISNVGRMTQNRLAAIDKYNAALANTNSAMVKLAKVNVSAEQERTKQSMERTAQAADRTRQALERTKQAQEMVRVAFEKTRQSVERTAQSMQKTSQVVERTKAAYEKTKQAVERTTQALERTKQASERTAQGFERTKQAVERTTQGFERTKQATERTAQAIERTKQSMERTTQAVERTRNSWVVYRQEQERTKQAAMHMVNSIAHVVTALIGMKSSAAGAGISLGSLVKGAFFGNALWDMVSGAIRRVTSSLANMLRMTTQAAGELQTLTIRLENMIARQIRAAGVTDDTSESLQIASGAAQETLRWLTELSFATPFSSQKIAETFTFATAMGWAVSEAKVLTTSILDFSAAMGLSSDTMDRIIYNFAQMKAAGKVTGTEMRDLARGAFFPLTDVLDEAAKQLGIAADGLVEFRAAAADGTIDIETFFDAFITVANRDFPNAAANMNNTLAAVIDNANDFLKTIIGWKVLNPALGVLTNRVAEFLEKLTAPEVVDAATRIGLAIKFIMESFLKSIDKVTAAFKNLFAIMGFELPTIQKIGEAFIAIGVIIDKISDSTVGFIGVIENFVRMVQGKFRGLTTELVGRAFDWGANIVKNFAQGMVDTAVKVIVTAMNFIGNLIASFLQAHSPPDILPDLPEWGRNAMAEYLRGFTMADFSVLDSIQGLMKSALGALVDLGKIGEVAGKEMFIGISESLIEAMDQLNKTGDIGQDIFDRLRDIGGGLGEELADLLGKQVNLAKATEELAAAQKAYNDAVEATKQAQASVNASIRKYNEMLREGASDADLAAQLKIVNAEEERLAGAVDQQVAAKKNVELWEEAIKPLEEAVKLQEKLIQQLIELMRAQADLDDARKRAAARGGGADDGDDMSGIDIPDFDFGGGGLGKKFNNWITLTRKKMEEKIGGIFDGISASWAAAISPVTTAFDDMMAKFPTKEEMSKRWSGMAEALKNAWADVPMTFEGIVGALRDTWNAFTILFPGLPTTGEMVEPLMFLLTWAEKAKSILLPMLNLLSLAFKTIYAVFTGDSAEKANTSLQKIVTTILDVGLVITTVYLGIITLSWSVVAGIVSVAGAIVAAIKGIFSSIGEIVSDIVSGVGDYITGMILQVQGLWTTIVGIFTLNEEAIKTGWDTFWEGVALSFVGFWTTIYNVLTASIQVVVNFVADILGFFLDLYNELIGNSIIPDMLTDIYNAFSTTFNNLYTFITDIFGDIATFITETAATIMADIQAAIDLLGELLGLSGGDLNSRPNTDFNLNSTQRQTSGTGFTAPPVRVPAAPVMGKQAGGTTITFGDTIISNNMDAAEFRAGVIRVIRESG